MPKRSLEDLQKMADIMHRQCPLPPGVTCAKRLLEDARWAYIFHHNQWGELGRVVIVPLDGGNCQFSVEVAGDEDDPMTQKRMEILKPLTTQVSKTMEQLLGKRKEKGKTVPYQSPKEFKTIEAQHLFCDQCNDCVGLLVFADDARTVGQLEDYARIMFSKIKEINVPTWVLGEESEVYIDGKVVDGEALVLKVWPTRESARVMNSKALEIIFDELTEKHCR